MECIALKADSIPRASTVVHCQSLELWFMPGNFRMLWGVTLLDEKLKLHTGWWNEQWYIIVPKEHQWMCAVQSFVGIKAFIFNFSNIFFNWFESKGYKRNPPCWSAIIPWTYQTKSLTWPHNYYPRAVRFVLFYVCIAHWSTCDLCTMTSCFLFLEHLFKPQIDTKS